jgi:hypothetical protein
MSETAIDETGALVRRLARPHPSGGLVIERSVILAEGANSSAILSWISKHDGVADSTVPAARSRGLHGARVDPPPLAGPAQRFVLPARAFQPTPENPADDAGPEGAERSQSADSE